MNSVVATERRKGRAGRGVQPEYVRAAALAARLGIAEVTLWLWRRKGVIPPPVRLGPNVVAWSEATIRAWLESRQTVAATAPAASTPAA